MPIVDVYATAGTFSDLHGLALRLAAVVGDVEGFPDTPMFRRSTAAYIHEWPGSAFCNVDGESDYLRIQVITTAVALQRQKQLELVTQLTDLVAGEPGHPPERDHIWVLITEATDGGWGLAGHAYTNDELVDAALAQPNPPTHP